MTVSKPKMIESFITKNKYSRPGTKRSRTTKIAWHYTGAHDVSAKATMNYFKNLATTHTTYASSHFVCGLEGEIYYIVPMSEIAYTTNSANYYSIGIECATTGTDDHYSDKEYVSMVKLGAWLAQYYGLDPRKDFIRHYDVTRKICPRYFVNHKDKWNQFKLDCYNLKEGKIKVSDIVNCTNGGKHTSKIPSTTAKKQYLRVLQDVNVHSTPDFKSSSVCGKAEKGEALTIVKKIERAGTDMYLVKAGYYITASSKYVEVFER